MLKRQSRHLALLLVLTMLATLFVGVGVAQAKTINSVNKVVSVVDGNPYNLNELTIKADSDFIGDFKADETFEVVLPDGVKWYEFDTNVGAYSDLGAVAKQVSDTVAEFKISSGGVSAGKVVIPLSFEIDGASGTLAVKVDPLDSAVTPGSYNFAIVAEGDLTASVDSVKKIARNSSTQAGTIQLRESSVGAVAYGEVKVVVKLPSNFSWIMEGKPKEKTEVSFSGGFSGLSATKFSADGRELTIKFNAPKDRTQRGTIYITPFINPNRSASYGEVEVGIKADDKSGSVFDGDLVIAEYVDWGIKAKVKDVEELIAGKFDQKTAKITIEESVANTLLTKRDLTVELPEWVKITKVSDLTMSGGIEVTNPHPDGEKNYIDIPITKSTISSAGKIEFKLNLSIEGNKSGDIEAKIFGAGAEETSLVIAKAVAPVVPSIEKVNEVKIGIQSQPVADLTIVEGKKNGIRCDVKNAPEEDLDKKGQMVLSLTEGARFSKTPKVTVTDGNLEITQENVRLDANDEKVTIPIKSEGTKVSTVKVSDIMITLSRAVPEGDLKIKVGGNAVIENNRGAKNTDIIDPGEFTTGSIPVVAAKVITPADTNIHAVATYVIGNTVYQINGVDQAAMDQAPYIKNDRTFLPIRFVAYGLGIGDNGIIWDQVSQTVTLMKNDKVVQLKIGSTTMLVNGVSITMDAAPEVTAANRTCLPIRFVAEAFGAVVGWDAATQTVTVTL